MLHAEFEQRDFRIIIAADCVRDVSRSNPETLCRWHSVRVAINPFYCDNSTVMSRYEQLQPPQRLFPPLRPPLSAQPVLVFPLLILKRIGEQIAQEPQPRAGGRQKKKKGISYTVYSTSSREIWVRRKSRGIVPTSSKRVLRE